MNVVGFILLAIIFINFGIFLYTTGLLGGSGHFSIAPSVVSPPDVTYFGPAGATSTFGTTSTTVSGANIATPPQGFTKDQLSPYYGRVRFVQVEPGGAAQVEHVSLVANPKTGQTIVVTGWSLQANRAAQVIPQAIASLDLLHPTLEGDIRLGAGHVLDIYATRSAAGASFRLNRCTGYLQNRFNFIPALPQECPAVDRSDIVTFTGACQDYLLSLRSCQEPNPAAVPSNDSLCRYYINNRNYLGCVDKYKNMAGFYSNQWRVWTGAEFLDNLHDRLLLLDKAGKLVDVYVY